MNVEQRTTEQKADEPKPFCHASRGDGECYWRGCPQLRDGEPEKSGRDCQLWVPEEDE